MLLLWHAQTAFALSVEDIPNPRIQNGWVSDTAGLLEPDHELSINRKLGQLEESTGVEVAVVVVDSVDTPTPKDFATELFNRWGIGKEHSDNGMLILLVVAQRRLEMETGYGLENKLSDGWLKLMQITQMVPAFKKGNFSAGLQAGVDAVIEKLHAKPLGAAGLPAVPKPRPKSENPVHSSDSDHPNAPVDYDGAPWWVWVVGMGVVLSGFGVKRYKYRKDRTCPSCKKRMPMVPEEDDDAYYDAGQVTEERIDSVDYQYYFCKACDFHRILRVENVLSTYKRCGNCKQKTLSTIKRTLRAPTKTSTGLEEIILKCAHCEFHHTREKPLPALISTTDYTDGFGGGGGFSGGGGGGFDGGGFGGGSSGGGGAGSSW